MQSPRAFDMIHALPVLLRLAAVAASIGLRPAGADRTAKGRGVPALDLAAIAPRRAEARDLLPYLDAAGITCRAGGHLPEGRGAARASADVIALAAHPRPRLRAPHGARRCETVAEVVPLRRSA
jgi:hypothetical protein